MPSLAFILQRTRLQRPPSVPELALHLADEVEPLWRVTGELVGETDAPLPCWAFAWVGGQALARYLLDHRGEVAGKRVLDFASGSGICAIAAHLAGAASTLAADVDPFCAAAVRLNARVNGAEITFTDRNLLDADPPPADVILAGDICYERALADRALTWLRAGHDRGTRVLIGDPGRTYSPSAGLIRLATYRVATTRELEDREVKEAGVFTFRGGGTNA